MNDASALSVPATRFDQRNEIFKRSFWDESLAEAGRRFYREAVYQDRAGYRKIDYALRNASWDLEWSFGHGNARSGDLLYAWEGIPEKARHFVEAGAPVELPPAEMSEAVKRAARLFGAGAVGVTKVHPNWVYSHEFDVLEREHRPLELPEGCDHAVVLAIEMDYQALRSAPSGVGGAATGLGYSRMAAVARLVAMFIRGLGYRAIPCGNDTALSVPLALSAGLGEWSRMGLMVTPEFGPRVRLCKVFTDLPLTADGYRPFGVVDFCRTCKKCAAGCPSRAIPEGGMTTEGPNISSHSGIEKWYVDGERCFQYWGQNRMDCAVCIRVCPFNKPAGRIHGLARGLIKRTALANRPLVWIDDALGYGRRSSSAGFWGGSSLTGKSPPRVEVDRC
ncbi:MAG: reductive dehalogenase [Thermoleophilia bacterium]|nr:reductive dehalogenase [Thermoleophilia bacterium]